MGFTLGYVGLLVLVPLSTILLKSATMSWSAFWGTVLSPRVLASYRLSLGASLLSALINAVFGLLVTWVLVRYQFPGKRLLDGLVDLPFALPTAVAGIALTTLYASNGWIGRYLDLLGIKVAYAPLGVVIALTFIGLPFVVRTLEPLLQSFDTAMADLLACCVPRTAPGAVDRIRPGLCAEPGGVWIGDFYCWQYAHAHRDHAAPHYD
jgi:sulfate transport system permease protein